MINAITRKPENELFVQLDDGWNLPFYIAAVANEHPEIRGTHRPCLPAERSKILECLGRVRDEEEASGFVSKALAARIKSWNLDYTDPADKVRKRAPINEDFMRRLRYPMWEKLAAIVIYQTRPSDRDPLWSEDDVNLHDEAAFQAALTGLPQQDAKLGNMQKN